MGYLLPVSLALLFQALSEVGLRTDADRPWVVLMLAFAPHGLALVIAQLGSRGGFRLARPLVAALNYGAPFLHLAALVLGGWPNTIERLSGRRPDLLAWPHGVLLLAMAPFALYTLLSIDARARLAEYGPRAVAGMRRLQLRMFASSALPLVVYVLVTWGLGVFPTVRAFAEHTSLGGALLGGALILLFVVLLPQMLALAWDTRSLPAGELRESFHALACKAGFRCRDILEWRTGELLSNAAVVGVTPRQRVVLLTDALLSTLGPRELGAVFGHEIGHAKRGHVFVFAAWAVAFILGGDWLVSRWFADDKWMAAGTLLLVFGVWALAFGWLSRRAELDADLYGAELTGDVNAMVRALQAVGGVHSSRERSWRHFSTAERVSFLSRNALEPGFGRDLRRKLRVFSVLGFVLAAVALALQARQLYAAWPQEAVRADLATGRYERARARVATFVEPDADAERQIERAIAAGVDSGVAGRDQLERLGRESLGRGKLEAALDYFELARLRGSALAGRALDVLEAEGAAERAEALAWLRQRAPEWGADLERFLTAP